MLHNTTKQPIIFFGASQFVLPVTAFLTEHYDLKLVVTTEKNSSDPVPDFCIKNAIQYIGIDSFTDPLWQEWKLQIANWKLEIALLAYFGLIVPQSIIDMFPKGIINIHPSLLPLYRGPTPGQTALLLGDSMTGVSIMLLDKEIDHWPILAQEKETITNTDTATSLYERLFAKGVKLLDSALPAYLSNQYVPVVQDHTKATFTKSLTRDSGYIDPTKPIAAGLLERMIRAYNPWPGVWTRLRQGSSGQAPSKLEEKIIKLLPNQMLQVEGKRPMGYKDFVNGYKEGKQILQKLGLI